MGLTLEDAYTTLELPVGADQDAVRSSYKRLALKWHPDKHRNSPQATEKFQQISTAYKKLTTIPDETDSDEEYEMTMADMFTLFQQIYFSRPQDASNGYTSSDDDDEDEEEDYDDDEDEDDMDYVTFLSDRFKMRHEFRKMRPDSTGEIDRKLTAEQIEKNANELITEEEKEKRRAEKRRAKKKRRREKKRLEKQQAEQQKKEDDTKKSSSQKQKQENNTNHEKNNKSKSSSKKQKQRKSESSQSDQEEFDSSAAFFTKVVSKKKKAGLPVDQPNSKSKQKDGKSQNKNEEEVEELDPIVLRSRQLAIRGNEMANLGHYTAAIDLFSEAIKLDPRDFRFFGNRSYCFDRIQQYERALRDADKAISLAPDWPKGYFRKGRALAGLKLYADAEQAFMQVLKLDRNCTDARQELLRVRTHQLTEMGFSRQQAESAIKQHNTVQQALDSLLAGVVAENSLAGELYVSDEEEFANTTEVSPQPVQVPQLTQPTIPTKAGHASDVKMDPTNPEGLTALWVGNVLPDVSEKKLVGMFSKYGTVTSVRCLPDKYCAFINFKTKESAGRAMQMLQGVECGGQRLLIKFPDNPIVNGQAGSVVIRKTVAAGSAINSNTTNTAAAGANQANRRSHVLNEVADTSSNLDQTKISGPVNGDECYFWRTTGCHYGKNCHWKHIPDHKGVDRKPWQKVKKEDY